MKDDETVKERVILLDGLGDGLPSLARNRARIEKGIELKNAVAYVAGVCAGRGPKTV